MSWKIKKYWFVLCSKVFQELKILELLNQLKIEKNTQTKIVLKFWSDRKKNVKNLFLNRIIVVSNVPELL